MFITEGKFLEIKSKYGYTSSWALWKDKYENGKEKSNIGDITIFDRPKTQIQYLDTLNILNPNIVFVGLNISNKILAPFANFHSTSSRAHDYKLRYAIKDTLFHGAYMTDIIKDFENKSSGNIIKYVNTHFDFLQENITSFENELLFIGAVEPILIAFGNNSYELLKKHFKNKYSLFKVPHYSSCITKEELRKELIKISHII